MKKNIYKYIVSLILCLAFALSAGAEPKKPSKQETPKVNAKAAILMDFDSGRVLWEKNSREPLAMASTTKIMTAIITIENGNLDETVTVSKCAASAPKVNMNLKTGEKIKLRYLLYALMLQSSNDAAVAIAEHIGGNAEDFCAMMNAKAKEIGALDTIFETPNGLDKGDHHSTAYDLALIAQYALKNEEFVKLIQIPSVTVTSDIATHYIDNKNRLLDEYEGSIGVKTGFTGKAGHCFVGAARRGGLQIISVVLASGWSNFGKEQKWKDTKAVLNYGFENYQNYKIIDKGGIEKIELERAREKSLECYVSEDYGIPMTNAEKEGLKVVYELPDSLKAPVSKDQTVGKAKIFINDQLIKEIDLLAASGIERFDLVTSVQKVISEWLELGTTEKVNYELPEEILGIFE